MSSTKEAMVIILDVGKNSSRKDKRTGETFITKEKKCCIKLFQRKIFSAKNDEIALVLMGAQEASNELNSTMGDYGNICEAIQMSLPNWEMIRAISKLVEHQEENADWLDALIVGMDIIKRESGVKKFQNFKIVLFTTFSTYVNDDSVSSVIKGLNDMDIELVIINDSIEFLDENDGESQAVFSQQDSKTEHQKISEQVAQRIIEETNGNLCNFEFAIRHLIKFQRRKSRPWYWYCTLEIGSEISIQTCSLIAVKEEQHFKWNIESCLENTKLTNFYEYYKNGEKIDPDKEDLIKAYMLGSTPIPCDKSLGIIREFTKKGIQCVGFTSRSLISDEFMAGNGSYIVLPKKGFGASEKMFVSLVQAMIKADCVMIAQRVYANNYKPKLVALIPNIGLNYQCLTMIELYFADQYYNWFFSPIKVKKTQLTPEQYSVIDQFIDLMDLTDIYQDESKEYFSTKNLMHISLQHIYETATKRALNPKVPVPTLEGKLAEALEIPSQIKEQCATALKEIKALFPLIEINKLEKRELIRKLGDIPAHPGNTDSIPQFIADQCQPEDDEDKIEIRTDDGRVLIEVGTVTPSKDFVMLAKGGINFAKLSRQMGNIVCDLVFKSMTNQNEKIAEAMVTFREEAKFFGPWEYNDWIRELKKEIITRKRFDFWQNVVVKDHLGLVSLLESDLVDSISEEEAKEFYQINIGVNDDNGAKNDENQSVDDLFDNM